MNHRLNWSFGEPRAEDGVLLTHFYYQPGKHVELRLPWPARKFDAAGGLPVVMTEEGGESAGFEMAGNSADAGRQLYERLGKEAQATLIRAFANLDDEDSERILFLRFSIPTPENRELCLALEDLPWESLHDGETFLSWRYSLQIVRSHARDPESAPERKVPVTSWRILLVAPFVQKDEAAVCRAGLAPLPMGVQEIQALRHLQEQMHGLVRIAPDSNSSPQGFTGFAQLEQALLDPNCPAYALIHFIGHGVMFEGEPCLCFEREKGGIEFVSVARLRKLLLLVRENRGSSYLPSVLFLNACSSSRRGRYSTGFASGLHDLGICVLGYSSEIRDDEKPVLAARSFYQSLCIDQSLQNPDLTPSVTTAIGQARRTLHSIDQDAVQLGSSLRAYIPADISFEVKGRGFWERGIQALYSRWANWMNPLDYTDHLNLGFSFALLFGLMLGLQNLLLIFPEAILSRNLTYQEIVSELARILLVGPLSFLVSAIWVAWQTQRNHKFMLSTTRQRLHWPAIKHTLQSLPIFLLAGISFSALFAYSFSRLDILTAQTVAIAGVTQIPVPTFWYGLNLGLGCMLSLGLLAATWVNYQRRITLHSYNSFVALSAMYVFVGLVFLTGILSENLHRPLRFGLWIACIGIHTFAFGMAVTKMVKETAWRASQKRREPPGLSWRKLVPLLAGVVFVGFCYLFLEESVRFDAHSIHTAMMQRQELLHEAEDPNLRDVRMIERALRQRAIRDIPDSVQEAAMDDWLLSVVCADYSLYRAVQESDKNKKQTWLKQSQALLGQAEELNPEVRFEDYYNNIYAMVNMLLADQERKADAKLKQYETARKSAQTAVEKDKMNFAYLDTLSRVEVKLAELKKDPKLLQQASEHNREAQWRAFFLRSPRAEEVQESINAVAQDIAEKMGEV